MLNSPQWHITLITVVDQEDAEEFLTESENAYEQMKQYFEIEPDQEDLPLTLYVTSNLSEYNKIGSIFGSAASSTYAVLNIEDSQDIWPISVTYSQGREDSQVRFTSGLVRFAVAEQYLDRTRQGHKIPYWFKKGQAAKLERYFHPEYIRWSIKDALIPLGGFIELSKIFLFFDATEREILTAGLVCAYLDSENVSGEARTALQHALKAIRKNENISAAFQMLEKTLMDDEEEIRAFMEMY